MIPRLLAITPGDDRALEPWLDALARGGIPGILLREPHRSTDVLARLVGLATERFEFVAVHARHPHWRLVVSETLNVAVHFPDHAPDGPPSRRVWGRSCHDRAGLDAAFAAGATYAFLSPVWSPTSKPEDHRPTLGSHRFLEASAERPVFALGGATPARARALRLAGGWGTAVLGALFDTATPDAATAMAAAFRDALEPR